MKSVKKSMKRKKKKLIILGNGAKPRVRSAVHRLKRWLSGRAEILAIDLDDELDLASTKADLAVVIGGDGAILRAARRLGHTGIPLLGFNVGKLGFLAEFGIKDFKQAMTKALNRRLKTSSRMMIECSVLKNGRVVHKSLGLNDAVISRGALSRLIYVELRVDEEELTTYAGDGLIISTPVGSTAHSLSAGGPILEPGMEAFIITPICAHTLTDRPLVVPATRKITARVSGAADHVALTVDGQVYVELKQDDEVRVVRAPVPLRLVETGERTYYQTLRNKLGWGGHPYYGKS